eukprot:546376-Pyramimonas_sp.AAC.1
MTQPAERAWIVTDAFDVLKQHTDPSAPYPHREMIPLLLRILEARGAGASADLLPHLLNCCKVHNIPPR